MTKKAIVNWWDFQHDALEAITENLMEGRSGSEKSKVKI
jgi:hypothetical protein